MAVHWIVPPEWSGVYALLVGQQWPEGDEDKLRGAAQAWTDAINALLDIADGGNSTARDVNYSVQAVSADQFNAYWNQWVDGDNSYLGELAKQCETQAVSLLRQAQETEYTKLTIDITVLIVIIQLAVMLAMAAVTAGGSLTGWAIAIFLGRQAVLEAFLRFVEQVIAAVLPDVIAQTIMMANGHESTWDWGKTGEAVASGVAGAAIGAGVGALGGKLTGRAFESMASSKVTKLLAETALHSAEGAVTNGLTSVAMAGGTSIAQSIKDGTPVWPALLDAEGKAMAGMPAQLLSGAGTGAAFHLVHAAGSALSPYHGPVTTLTMNDGKQVRAYQSGDGYKVVDEHGMPLGTGTMATDRSSFTLDHFNGKSQTVDLTNGHYSVTDTNGHTTTYTGWDPEHGHTQTYTTETTRSELTVSNQDGTTTTFKPGTTITHSGDVTGPVVQAQVPHGSTVEHWNVDQNGDLAVTGWQKNTSIPGLGTVHTDYYTGDAGQLATGTGDKVATYNGWTSHTNVTDQSAYHNTFSAPVDRPVQPAGTETRHDGTTTTAETVEEPRTRTESGHGADQPGRLDQPVTPSTPDTPPTANPEPGAVNRLSELRTELVVPDQPPAARVQRIVSEGDHLLVEISDGDRTGQLRVDRLPDRLVFRSLDETGEALSLAAEHLLTPDGTFTIVSHADEGGIVVDGMHVPFEELAGFLPELPEGTTIRMLGCEAGAGDAIEALARITGHDVVATDADVWVNPRTGDVLAARAVELDDGRVVPRLRPDGEGHLVGDGTWRRYHRTPDGEVVVRDLAPDDPRVPTGYVRSVDDPLLRLTQQPDELGWVGDYFGPRTSESAQARDIRAFGRREPSPEDLAELPDAGGKWLISDRLYASLVLPRLQSDQLNMALRASIDTILKAELGRTYAGKSFADFMADRKMIAVPEDNLPPQARLDNAKTNLWAAESEARMARQEREAIAADLNRLRDEKKEEIKNLAKARKQGANTDHIQENIDKLDARIHKLRSPEATAINKVKRTTGREQNARSELTAAGNAVQSAQAGTAPTVSREAAYSLREVAAMRANAGSPDAIKGIKVKKTGATGKRDDDVIPVRETITVHGIPVQVSWGETGGTNGAKVIFAHEGRYRDVLKSVTDFRSHAPDPAAFDREYAKALLDLARPGTSVPDSLRLLTEAILPAPDPPGGGDRERFQREVAALMMLTVNLEGARSPDAYVTNLMVWDMVSDGHLSLEHALTYLNVMGPSGATQVGAVDYAYNEAGRFPKSLARGRTANELGNYLTGGGEKVAPGAEDRVRELQTKFPGMHRIRPDLFDAPDAPHTDRNSLQKLGGEFAPLYVQERVAEFQIRQREIIALFAVKNDLVRPENGEDLPTALNRYFYNTPEFTHGHDPAHTAGQVDKIVNDLLDKLGMRG